MNTDFRILILEDSKEDAELMARELRKTPFQFTIKHVASRESFIQALKEFNPEIILSDYNLPSFDGLSALALARKECPHEPFIFVSGSIGEERAIETLKKGATDYVLKDNLFRLVPAIERAMQEIAERAAREKVQEELRMSEARFRAFMDNSPAVAFLKTTEGRYVYVNKPFEERFHVTKADLLYKTDSELWPAQTAARFQKNDREVLSSNRTVESMEDLSTPDGISHSWLVFNFPVSYSSAMKFIGGIAIDVTEQRQAEQKLKQAIGELGQLNAEMDKKNEELKKLDRLKSDLISNVSHELRTPMTIMRESVSQIIDGLCGEVTDPQQKRLFSALNNMDRLKHIVDNLLDVSQFDLKKVRLQKDVLDIVQLVKEIGFSFEPKIRSKGLDIRYHFSMERIQINADKDKLIQVFVNLISNAVKFTDKGLIEIFVDDNERKVECRVADSGRGISEQNLSKVFDKFEQFGRQEGPGEKGTGLGLAICQEIVHLHRGEIWVNSEQGIGTTFTFVLPKISIAMASFQELADHVQKVLRVSAHLAMVILTVDNFDVLQQELGADKVDALLMEFERLIKQCLRRGDDEIMRHDRFLFIILPGTNKDHALIVSGRIQQTLDDYLAQANLKDRMELTIKVIERGGKDESLQELMDKVGLIQRKKGESI